MEYFKAKSDFTFMIAFRQDVMELGRMEGSVRNELGSYAGFSFRSSIPSEQQKMLQNIATSNQLELNRGVVSIAR
jgi:hypothetical protein